MGRTGRPPKPIEQKRKLGNPGKRKLPTPITALAPVHVLERELVTGDGQTVVQAILDAGASAWVGGTDRLGLLQLLADAWDERIAIRTEIGRLQDADMITGLDEGTAREKRDALLAWTDALKQRRRELRDLEKQITAWLSLLGLTPADRSRLGVAEVKARTKLEQLRDRRAVRAGHRAG